jgi:hypothetical protein
MSVPPELMQMLQGAAGGAPPGAGPEGTPPGAPPGLPPDAGPPPDQGGGGSQPLDLLKQLVDMIQQYLQAEPDEEDKLEGAKMLQLAQKLLAKDQQDNDAAMGGANQRILRKAG